MTAESRIGEAGVSEPPTRREPAAIVFLASAILGSMAILPVAEALLRRFAGVGLPGGDTWIRHLTLWVGMLGAVLASFRHRHIAITLSDALGWPRSRPVREGISRSVTVIVLLCLAVASGVLVGTQVGAGEKIARWLPVWIAQLPMPVGFLTMAAATVGTASGGRQRLLIAGVGLVVTGLFLVLPPGMGGLFAVVSVVLLVLLAGLGVPIFAVLGGAALLLFFAAGVPTAAVPTETYRIVTQPVLPSIPLFALAGVVLARGGAPERLVRLVRAWTGWMRGGASIATILGCAFFTAVTGASGVTILALGGLFLPVLLASGRSERFGVGLLTASGSVGLLFPPSLPVILYGVYGRVGIDRLFLAGFLPGVLVLIMLSLWSLRSDTGTRTSRARFEVREALAAVWGAKGDLLLPIAVAAALFGGFMTIVEVAALAALWAVALEVAFYRTIDLRELGDTLVETATLVGALLAILGMALGLVSYLVDAQVPFAVADWVTSVIGSRWIFLLVLNVLLLMVGALMDIYSAIVVVVPLIVPTARAFGIDPAHLGIIFLTNLELGYLTPPVGMNLFLSSLRFERPLMQVWRSALPFLAIMAVWVLLVTYLPWLTTGFASLLGR